MHDVIVAGGGPVGLAAALHAHRAGLDVVVREPRTGPIDKACGEGLMPGAVLALHDLGITPAGHPIAGIRYLDGQVAADAPFHRGPGLGVRRTVLHAAMLDAVGRAGIVVTGPAVRQVQDRGDHLLVDGAPTRFLLAADGLHSRVRRLAGLDGPARPAGYRRHGLRRHVDCPPWTDFVEVHWSSLGEAYVTPISERQVAVASYRATSPLRMVATAARAWARPRARPSPVSASTYPAASPISSTRPRTRPRTRCRSGPAPRTGPSSSPSSRRANAGNPVMSSSNPPVRVVSRATPTWRSAIGVT